MKAHVLVPIAFCAIISCFLFNEGAQSISGIYFVNLFQEFAVGVPLFTKIFVNLPS